MSDFLDLVGLGQQYNISLATPSMTAAFEGIKKQAILAPRGAKGIGGFVFDIPTRETLTLETDITDHYMENGSYTNDHAVDKPVKATLSGFVGELFVGKPTGLLGAIEDIGGALGPITGFVGEFLPAETQAFTTILDGATQVAATATAAIQKAANIVGSVSNLLSGIDRVFLKRQKEALNTLDALRRSRSVFSLTLPWAYYENMMIESITVEGDQESEQWSEFSVSLKQVRFAEVKRAIFDSDLFPPRNEIQNAGETAAGAIQGAQSTDSVLMQGYNKFGPK
jgi:hypothetical protein